MGQPAATASMNSDQVFSVMRQLMTALGGVLLGSLESSLQNLIIGVVPIVVSIGWSVWRNVDNLYDMVFSGSRQAVLLVGAYAVAKGWIGDQQIQYLSGTVFAIISSVASMWFYRDAPGPMLPGTTIVDPPKQG